MKKENNNKMTFKWRRLFRKKWLYPAIYITVAALLLSLVIWYQNLDQQIPDLDREALEVSDHYIPVSHTGEEDGPEQTENILRPVSDDEEIEIVTEYYDYDAEASSQEKAIILFDKHYLQSTGIDLARKDGESFDVQASLSGTVKKVKDDPILGMVVILSHKDDVETFYSSLTDVSLQEGMQVSQGDLIGKAGKNVFGKDKGVHLHFEIRKNNLTYNPERYFNESVASLMLADASNEEEEDDSNEDESL